MTSALNRKFDLLCRSGTCPAYLMDVLSLLVVHANDTELFKTECRAPDVMASSHAATAPASAAHTSGEQDAAERRLALVRKQAEDPEELDAAIRASHETVLLAAEHSLRTYAENLKHANDIALAATEKQLRALRVETRAELEQFQKLALESTVEQTRSELDLLRADWFAETRGEVEQLRASVHDVGLAAQTEVHDLTRDYAAFVAQTHTAICHVPLVDAHRSAGASLVMEAQVETMLRTMANREDVTVLEERVKSLEKASARLARPDRPDEDLPPLGAATVGCPADGGDGGDGGDGRAVESASAAPPLPGTAQASPATAQRSACDRIGLSLREGRNGLCVTAVEPDSLAWERGISVGTVVSHVGRTHVADAESYSQAVEAAAAVEGGTIKITLYDPQAARVRVVAV